VSVLLASIALFVVASALVAIGARDARLALSGVVMSMSAASALADPWPSLPAIAARIVAVLLGGYLCLVVLRITRLETRGSLIGLPAQALAAGAAFVVGFGASGLGAEPLGPAEAQAAGFALIAVAVAPVVRATDVFRLGVALAISVTGALLVRVGLAGTPGQLEQLMTAGLSVALLGSVAILCANAVAASGTLRLSDAPVSERRFEAHPSESERVSAVGLWRARAQDRTKRFHRGSSSDRADSPEEPSE